MCLVCVFGTIVAEENEKGVFDEFFSGATRVVGSGEVVAETADEDIVFVNEIESHAVSGRAVFVSAGSDDLLGADFFIGRVRAMIDVGSEVEEEGFFLRVRGVEEGVALLIEDTADLIENIRAIELLSFTGGSGDLATMNPTRATLLIGCVRNSTFSDFAGA